VPPSDRKHLDQIIASYDRLYQDAYRKEFRAKLGRTGECSSRDEAGGDDVLIKQLLDMMLDTRSDFTMTFRQLGDVDLLENRWRTIDYNDKR